MKKSLFFAATAALMMLTASCGEQSNKQASKALSTPNTPITSETEELPIQQEFVPELEYDPAPEDTVISQITNDILALPEMQFPHAAVMVEDLPSDTEPYYTVKGGSNMDDRFVTSFWFRVYVEPEYEIKIWDIVFDSVLSLEEWRKERDK